MIYDDDLDSGGPPIEEEPTLTPPRGSLTLEDVGIALGGQPRPSTPPTTPPTGTSGRPLTPQERAEVERRGREEDARNGRVGGYMNGDVWVSGSPSGGPPPPGGDNFFGGGGQLPNANFQWPKYNPQTFGYAEFGGFKPWQPPTRDEILADPGLQAQLTEGQKRIKGDRAFRGTLRSGDTLRDIFDWTSDRIKLGANEAYDRSFRVYDVNERQNPFNTWSANKDLALSSFDRNSGQQRDAYLYNEYNPALERFRQNYNMWSKQGDWLSAPVPPPD